MKNQTQINKVVLFAAVLAIIVIAGCIAPPQPTPKPVTTNTTIPTTNTTVAPVGCTDKDCFIAAANKCENASILFTDTVGTFKYSASDCIFTKTLLALNSTESDEMKNLLQGKNMTCRYKQGNFDQRLVTSLIFGMEYCEGDLKEALAELTVFSQ